MTDSAPCCTEGEIVPLTDVCENERGEEWHALCLEDRLDCVTAIKALVGEHECPMNCACGSKLMEAKGAADNFIVLLDSGIWCGTIICDGDVMEMCSPERSCRRRRGDGLAYHHKSSKRCFLCWHASITR